MHALESRSVSCPYCGENIEVLIDCSISRQDYIEDCQVCCRPIDVSVTIDAHGDIYVSVTHENE